MSGIAEVSPNYLAEMASNAIALEYKQTEVGMIPEDWEVKSIGEISSVFSGGTPNRKIPEYWDGDIPWVTTTLIDGAEISTAKEFITQRGLENSSTKWCKAGTILLAMYGQGKTRGKAAILSIDATINQACAAIELKDVNSSHYVLHILNSMYEEIRELSNSGGQENLSGGIIKSIQIPVPPKSEQTAIANALSDVDALIGELEKLIAKKQAIKTATMQQLLTGRTRLPQFALREDGTKKSTKPSELGEIPEDWEVMRLGHLAKFFKGSGLPKSELSESGKIKCIHYGQLFTTYGPKIDRVISRTKNLGIVTSQENDVLMPTSDVTPNGLATASCITETGVTLGGDILIIRSDKQRLNGVFFSYLVNVLRDQVMQLVTGSTVYHLYGSDMAKFEFAFPPKEEQTAIATILSDMDAEIHSLEQRLGKTRHIKQGMMQELLTGKTRLIKPSKEVIHE
ncbi:type I restriction modification DNA specificity domain protein [Vibrio cholerae]|uniref:restriction endonuclease subunit S n=1 Tax=Vibrio cholerae TaxID=666 RepID=UPI0004E2D344|nr:restriction endonuclease subunit S [Vibrio cholerae]KFE05369.1 type I restriction modification DNA specificity domain protein [Vibrio cholerae]